jgi:hypothetical protein
LEFRDLKQLKKLLQQFKRNNTEGWTRNDIEVVLDKVDKEMEILLLSDTTFEDDFKGKKTVKVPRG